VAANTSFLSWFGLGSSDLNNTFSGAEPEESGECLKKTHEFLERALENLCQIFKVRLLCCSGFFPVFYSLLISISFREYILLAYLNVIYM